MKIVANVNTVEEEEEEDYVEHQRKKPQSDEVNEKDVELVWGGYHTNTIVLLQIRDNYNHWMLETDLVD